MVVAALNPDKSASDSSASARVRLLLADLRRLSVSDTDLIRVLTPVECKQADRFRQPIDRRRFIVGRVLIRSQLAKALSVAPSDVQLKFGSQGKPFIADGPAFNLSHSGHLVVLGLTVRGRIGIDVERNDSQHDVDQLMRRCFSPWEMERVRKLNRIERRAAFFRIWARKEALLKALGGGLSINLKRVSVDHNPVTGNVLHEIGLPDEVTRNWAVLPLDVGPLATGALALDRPDFDYEITQISDVDLGNVICALAR